MYRVFVHNDLYFEGYDLDEVILSINSYLELEGVTLDEADDYLLVEYSERIDLKEIIR